MNRSTQTHSPVSSPSVPSIRSVVNVPLVLRDGRTVPSQVITFKDLRDSREHFAVKLGSPEHRAPLVRLHSECVTGDVMGSARCDCGPQLNDALRRLSEVGGYLLYLRQEGRGIGLFRKMEAYWLQERGLDTYAANRAVGNRDDERDYGVAADMLRALDLQRITLLSNNPDKRGQLIREGIVIDAQVPTGVFLSGQNRRYLETKKRVSHHTLDLDHAEGTCK